MSPASLSVRRLKEAYENLPLPPAHVVGLAADLLLDRIRPAPLPGSRSSQCMVGSVLVLAGIGLDTWALQERRRHTVGPFELERPEGLVTTGPYAITRHPMYLGWWFIRLGAGALAGSAWVLVSLPALSIAGHAEVLREEAMLARQFPAAYSAYAHRVPRYLGLPSRAEPRAGLPRALLGLIGAKLCKDMVLTMRGSKTPPATLPPSPPPSPKG